jgi:capsular polysaccharide biosynthesis protein
MTKLLFRRWYFSLPLLLVTLACVAVAAVTVKPDYSSIGHIQFIPPVGTTAKDGTKNPIDNPWYDLGYEALANATVIDVTKKSVLEKMAEEGLSDNITVTTDQVPLFAIEVVGVSPEQATATVQYVQKGIADAVQQRQDTLRVPETDTITTLQLDDGTEVEEKSSKIMRVMVVAFGLGLLLTAGVTIGIDALLRWRAGRRREDEDEAPAGSAVGSVPPSGRTGTQMSSNYESNFEKTQAVIPPAQPGPQQGEPQQPARPAGNGKPAPAPPPQQRRAGSDGTYRSQQSAAGNGPDPRLEQAPADATIVLPPWGWKRDEKAERR